MNSAGQRSVDADDGPREPLDQAEPSGRGRQQVVLQKRTEFDTLVTSGIPG